eukprot:TRINITY_DN15744_c0_g1_i1.p1 TRINITY_DN15744_c0_g1~~TRINITY_DN15744_c0_g1_i1.p1  ORF type:complete len:164 (+),score=7.66 TRINITY_DN15744_c0_g1_i1:354-845(+)
MSFIKNITGTMRPVDPTFQSSGLTNSRPPGPTILRSSDPPLATQFLRHMNISGPFANVRNPIAPGSASYLPQDVNLPCHQSTNGPAITTFTGPMLSTSTSPFSPPFLTGNRLNLGQGITTNTAPPTVPPTNAQQFAPVDVTTQIKKRVRIDVPENCLKSNQSE